MKVKLQAGLKILSQSRKDLRTEVARIKQTIEKFFDEYKSLAELINTIFCDKDTKYQYLLIFNMVVSTIALAIADVFVGGHASGHVQSCQSTVAKYVEALRYSSTS